MAVKIRLARHGAKKRPFYRIVVADSESPRDGRFLENLGTYDPKQSAAKLTVKPERVRYWMEKGATPTDTLERAARGLEQEHDADGAGRTRGRYFPVPRMKGGSISADLNHRQGR